MSRQENRVYIEKIDRKTAMEIKDWGCFDDPRLIGYNYGGLTDFEINFWYNSISTPRKKYFAVRTKAEDRFIGFLGLKNYNPLSKKSKLGIVFDPNYVSQGYGYDAMCVLLDYYFDELNFKEIHLEVNLFNNRAISLYKKLGFKEIGYTKEAFENQEVECDNRYFEIDHGILYAKILKMILTKDDYYEL